VARGTRSSATADWGWAHGQDAVDSDAVRPRNLSPKTRKSYPHGCDNDNDLVGMASVEQSACNPHSRLQVITTHLAILVAR
jgi:hypothetical protein